MLTPPVLETSRVRLRLLQKSDYPALLTAARDPDTWRWFPLELSNAETLSLWVESVLHEHSMGTRIPLTITNKEEGGIIGSRSYMYIAEKDLCLEIGTTWIAKKYHGSGINYHMKYSMLKHVFEHWNFERVEFRTDALNIRSRKAIEKIGATYEGLFRNHRFNKEGGRRDSVIYSILKSEWPEIKQRIFNSIE